MAGKRIAMKERTYNGPDGPSAGFYGTAAYGGSNKAPEKKDFFNTPNLKLDMIWNTAGSLTYALSSMVLAFVVMNLCGPEDGGIFGFGFSTFGQQMFILAYFGIRPFHITDASFEYTFGDYRKVRYITSAAAAVFAFVYMLYMSSAGVYADKKATIIVLLVLYKIADGIADVYESECQRVGFLWKGGMALFLRTVVVAAAFIIRLSWGGDLFYAAAAAVILQVVCLYQYSRILSHTVSKTPETLVSRNTLKLLRNTVLLFLSVFLDFYIFSAVKYAIDLRLGDAESGIFNILFMPTSVIYLAANFIIKPFMTRLSGLYAQEDRTEYKQNVRKIMIMVLGLTAVCVLGALILGRPVLAVLESILGVQYSGMLTRYHIPFVIIIFGGGMYAMANLFYYLLVIMRRQIWIFGVYLVMAGVAFLYSGRTVSALGIPGAAICYAVLMTIVMALFMILSALFENAGREAEEG